MHTRRCTTGVAGSELCDKGSLCCQQSDPAWMEGSGSSCGRAPAPAPPACCQQLAAAVRCWSRQPCQGADCLLVPATPAAAASRSAKSVSHLWASSLHCHSQLLVGQQQPALSQSAACGPAACTVTGCRTPSSAAGSRGHLLRVLRAAGRPPCQLHMCLDPRNIQHTACRLAQGKPGSLTAGGHAIRRALLC